MAQASDAVLNARQMAGADDRASGSSESDFETAIAACGFGCFNITLLIVSMSELLSTISSVSSIAYIIPTAECDLHLTLMQKGTLNAMCFAGMIVSAIPWGFIADTMGRKKILVYGLILDGIMLAMCGLSQNVTQLLIFKFLDGFFICGPFAVVMSNISEFHGIKYRTSIMMLIGMINSAANVILPLLACLILPHHILYEWPHFRLHTWHIFLLIIAILPLLGGILHAFFPESPKFLMSNGRNSEALECFKTIYAVNKCKPKSTYPITKLHDEDPKKTERHSLHTSTEFKASHSSVSDKGRLVKEEFLLGLAQLKPMFNSPYFKYSLQVYSMFFFLLLGFNAIRLWLPQIFATMVEYEHKNMKDISMCRVLEYNYNKTKLLIEDTNGPTCDVHISSDSYTDNIIVAVVSFSCFILVTLVVHKVGNHFVLKVCLLITLLSSTAMYFSKTQIQTIILASTLTSSTSIGATAIISISVNYFPTYMRTMVVIMIMTFGRCGSVLGNVLFPYFISLGCLPPFLLIGGVIMISFILSLCLPNTNNPT